VKAYRVLPLGPTMMLPSAFVASVTLTAPAGEPVAAVLAVGAAVGATVAVGVAAAEPHAATRNAATKAMPANFAIYYSQNSQGHDAPCHAGSYVAEATPDQV
jgi:hypothetical protein